MVRAWDLSTGRRTREWAIRGSGWNGLSVRFTARMADGDPATNSSSATVLLLRGAAPSAATGSAAPAALWEAAVDSGAAEALLDCRSGET